MFIVNGTPDVLSGESDDERFIDLQTVGPYTVRYGSYGSAADQYGLLFLLPVVSKSAVESPTSEEPVLARMTPVQTDSQGYPSSVSLTQAPGSTITIGSTIYTLVAVVDYPNVRTVELDGVLHTIQIQDGIIIW